METQEIAKIIEEVQTQAQTVATQSEAHQEAIAAERSAEAALLDRLIEVVRPALRALSSRILTRHDTTGGANGCNPVEIKEYHATRGLLVVDEYRRNKDSSGNSGSYSGYGVYLLADGTLARAKQSGTWSAWQGDWDRTSWELTPTTSGEVMKRDTIDEIVVALAEALEKQSGLDGAAKAAVLRTEKLTALLALMK